MIAYKFCASKSILNRKVSGSGRNWDEGYPSLIKCCGRSWENNGENVIYLSSAVNDIIKKLKALTTQELEKVDSTCRLFKLSYHYHYSFYEYLLRSLQFILSSISNKFLDKLPASCRKKHFDGNPDIIQNINLSLFILSVKIDFLWTLHFRIKN